MRVTVAGLDWSAEQKMSESIFDQIVRLVPLVLQHQFGLTNLGRVELVATGQPGVDHVPVRLWLNALFNDISLQSSSYRGLVFALAREWNPEERCFVERSSLSLSSRVVDAGTQLNDSHRRFSAQIKNDSLHDIECARQTTALSTTYSRGVAAESEYLLLFTRADSAIEPAPAALPLWNAHLKCKGAIARLHLPLATVPDELREMLRLESAKKRSAASGPCTTSSSSSSSPSTTPARRSR